MSIDNIDNGWLGSEDKESGLIKYCDCEWCGEPIFYGDEYYNIAGEKICCECIEDCKKIP